MKKYIYYNTGITFRIPMDVADDGTVTMGKPEVTKKWTNLMKDSEAGESLKRKTKKVESKKAKIGEGRII